MCDRPRSHIDPGGESVTDLASNDAAAADLVRAVLDAEAERTTPAEPAAPTAGLPGVGRESVTVKEALARGGVATFLVLLLLNSLDELEAAALAVLAPDIR